MNYEVIVHPTAKDDLDRNAAWWAEHHSPAQAVNWLLAMERQLQALASSPERRALSPEDGDFPFEIRDYFIGLGSRPTYRAIFTIQNHNVHVLAVHRAAQDVLDPRQISFDPGDGQPN